MKNLLVLLLTSLALLGCKEKSMSSSDRKDMEAVDRQQDQYAKGQPIPMFDWSLERERVINLYKIRNQKAATHSVWRSDYGTVEGDCPSQGYGIPYDTSLTNPLKPLFGYKGSTGVGAVAVEMPEPNGVYSSKNTAATWVLCTGDAGTLEPIYVESKVTVYPGPVRVDYETGRVTRSGAASVIIPSGE